MSADELLDSLVAAGIVEADGKLSANYSRDEA